MKFVFRGVSAAHMPVARSAPVRRIRVMLFVISIGAHAVAVFCIAHLVWQLRRHQQQNRRNSNGRPRSLSPPKKPLDVSDAQMQALVDRLQQRPTADDQADGDNDASEGSGELDERTSQWEEQLQKLVTERDSLKSQVDSLLEEKTALALSKQQLQDLLSQHETFAKENEGLRVETNQEKEVNANLNKENELLRNEVGRLTELVDQMKKAQEVFRTTRGLLAMPTMTRTSSGKKLSSAASSSSPQKVDPPV